MEKDCPRCGLINTPEASLCDCGYSFVSKTQQAPIDPTYAHRVKQRQRVRWGMFLGLIGMAWLLITDALKLTNISTTDMAQELHAIFLMFCVAIELLFVIGLGMWLILTRARG